MSNISILNQDKISRFQSELNNRKNKIILNKYNMSDKENSTSNIAYQENPESQQKSDAGFLQKILATGGDILGNVFTGMAKGVEGLYDFGASIVGGVGGLFDKSFQDRVKEHVAYDFVGENLTNPINKSFKDSYLNDWGKVGNFIQNVSNGVGQMLPSVVSNLVVPGSGLATLGLSATGNSTESAFKDGASYYRGLGYGAVSGAVEVATEKIGGKLFGNSAIDDALGLKSTTKTLFKGAKTKVGKVVQEALGEGIEEGLSELVSPLTENIYKDKNFFDGFLTKEHLSNIGQSALVGAGTSLVYGGTLGKINKNFHNANESLVELNNLDIKQENLHNSGELYEGGNEQKIEQVRQNILQELSDSVSKMNENSRTKFIESNKLQTILNSDGSLIASQANNNQNTVLDRRYHSPALRGKEQQIIDNLASQNVKTYSGELNSEENNRYTQFKQAQSALSKKGLVRSNYIISEASKKFDSYISGDTMVFGKDLFESDAWQKKLVHEVEHFTEGTKEWAEFADFVIKETDTTQANLDVLNKDYGVTLEDIQTLSESLKKGSLSKGQKTYLTELMATQSEYLFGNEQMINRLTQTKRNLAQKIFDRIKQFIQVLKAKTPDEKNMLRTLQKAESLFEKALSKLGTGYLVESMSNSIDNLSEVKYSKKNSILWDKLSKQEQAMLYKSIDEIHHQGFWEYQTQSGDYVIDINNKIIISDGNFQSPSIEKIVEFNQNFPNKISDARDYFYEKLTNGRTIQESIEFINDLYEEEMAILYGEENSKYNSESREQGRDNFQDRRNNQKQQRERNSGDTKYSLKNGQGEYNYSKGQIAKYIAEHSKEKAYSKSDAEAIINSIVENQLSFDGNFGEISNKTKTQAVDILWHALNTNNEGYRAKTALQIADYIINKAVVEDIYQSETNDSNLETINILRPYLHKLDLKSIKQEIQHHYDKDNSPYLLWATKDGGMSPDQVAQELESKGIKLDSYTSADLFFEMDSLYRGSLNAIKNQSKKMLTDAFSADDLKVLKQSIAKEILQGYDSAGHKTKFAETIDKYKGKIDSLKNAIYDVKLLNKAKNNVVSTIERLKDTFVKSKPAGWDVPQQVVDFVKKISKVETWRNDISKNARQYLYELQNNIDLAMDETQQSIYPFREVLKDLGDVSKGNFTASEYKLLDNILRQFEWQLKNYNKVNFEDKAQNIDEIAIQGVKESVQAQSIIKNNLFKNLSKKVYANPYERMAEIGLYRKNSIAMRLFEEIKQGDRRRASFIRDASNLFDEFFSKNKNYLNDLQKVDNYKVRNAENIELTKRQALVLYAISLREQGISHLFNISDTEGVVRLLDNKLSTQGKTAESFAKGQDIRVTQELIDSIKKSLTEVDKQYLKVVNKFFNELSKNAKSETDNKLYGITNIEDGYYFPLQVSKDKIFTEAGQNSQDINQYVLSMGMNKSTKTNANNKLVIDGIDNIIVKHINNMAMYYGFAVPISAYNRIMNKQIKNSGLDNTTNIRSEIMKFDTEFESYMNKLLRDVQGIGKEKSVVGSVLSKIRWATANSALGANPKVLVTQTTSLASGLSEFSAKYISKGMAHFFGEKEKLDLSKYSALMWERMELGNSVDTADIRQIGKEIGGKIGKAGAKVTKALTDFTTKPISWMDGNVIQTLWFASQYEVADTMGVGYEFGTEANKIEAGKRLDDVVFRTQQTSDPLGRSEWMRSNNEIVKFARMFTGDGIQLTGKLIADVNKYFTAKKMIKSPDSQLVEEGKQLLNETKTALKKSATAFILNQVMLVALAMMFKWIKGKKDDEEWTEIAKEETLANLFGLIPFGGDIYEKLSGYEPTNMAYTALSNIVDMTKDLYENSANLITGRYQDETKRNYSIRKTALSLSTLFGIPTRNIESYLKGIIGHVSPSTREQYEALFKTKSTKVYIDKIKKATQNGDETLANTLTNIMYGSRTGKIKDKKVLSAITNLIEQDFDVLPKTISKSITIDGESVNLTNRQFKQFQATYATSMESVSSLINSSGFETMDSPVQAKAIKYIYDYYYNLAQKELLGTDSDKKQYLFAQAIDIVTLSKIVGQVSQLESDTDKNGDVVTGSKKQKIASLLNNMPLTAVQKYMVMGYFGYKNANGERQVKAFIQTLKLTKIEKETLYKMCGY